MATAQMLSAAAFTLYEHLLRETTSRSLLAAQATRVQWAMDDFQQSITICPRCQAMREVAAAHWRAVDGQLHELVGRVTFIVVHCCWNRLTYERVAAYVNGLFWDIDDLLDAIGPVQ